MLDLNTSKHLMTFLLIREEFPLVHIYERVRRQLSTKCSTNSSNANTSDSLLFFKRPSRSLGYDPTFVLG
ncbi:hypothetical protein XELAEV_18012018mg [Xenopus laevis]|uniref:Uncharacterized protein n=1 Tax=Xenopus laevis TaxID=8355 RepID=A0A974DPJ5_XENLA|nr:hypothetical protein XELAEV_18012018mg [Xenopus laevis]